MCVPELLAEDFELHIQRDERSDDGDGKENQPWDNKHGDGILFSKRRANATTSLHSGEQGRTRGDRLTLTC